MKLAADKSLMGEAYPAAGLVCLFGFFLHIILSDPLLNALGFHYSADEGRFYEKIHPGTYFIFLSFFMLLASGSPLRQLARFFREQKTAFLLLTVCLLAFAYMMLRSGSQGIGFMIDTHMTVPLCAIVLAYTPLSYCKRAVGLFIAVAAFNSVVGLVEAFGKFRLFSFDPAWGVLKEHYFRASALRGHPLNNAMFTVVALFVMLAMRWPAAPKILLTFIFAASLIAFGSRVAIIFGLGGLAFYSILALRGTIKSGRMNMARLLIAITCAFLLPLGLVLIFYLPLENPMGERLLAMAQWEHSADSRRLVFRAFDYINSADILFGMSMERVHSVASQLSSSVGITDIENPWILMLMRLGIVMFAVWLLSTVVFIFQLIRSKPLALQLAIVAYFITASTSNSFGRKDSTYLIMICAIMCASAALLKLPKPAGKA